MITLYCLAFIVFLPILLSLGSIPFRVRQFSRPDIQRPREQAEKLTGAGARIVHAQSNSWEAAILFIGTLFIAIQSGVALDALVLPSLIFAAIRVLYCAVYLLGLGYARFISFLTSVGVLFWILGLAFF